MITSRSELKIGILVEIIDDLDNLEEGYIEEIISKNSSSKGIKVRLKSGSVGRVVRKITRDEIKQRNKIYLNKFLSSDNIYSVWDNIDHSFVSFISSNQKVVFLYNDKLKGEEFLNIIKPYLKNTNTNTNINIINKRYSISENIKHLNPKYIVLNNDLRITFEEFKKIERHFINLVK